MAKDSIRDYSATSSSNSDIQSVDISEGCAPSGLNNAIREVMTDLKNVSTGTVALETPVADSFSTDTISEKTSATGVTVDGVLLKDGAIGSIANAVAAHLTSINGGQIGGSRNLIINGNMACSQRATQATGITTTGFRTVDRFRTSLTSLGTWTEDQSTDAPDGFSNSFKLTCTTADASPAAGDVAYIRYMFEGNELQMLSYGTSSAKAMTLSFWVKSNKTGSATVQLLQNDNSAKNISPSYTISSANTWEYKTVSIPADTAGNIDNDNGPAVALIWYLNSGSNYSSGTTRTTWTAYSATDSNPANLGVGGATSDYFQITGVSLEIGDVATPFEHESFAETLQKCMRYYTKSYNYSDAPATVTSVGSIYKVMDATISYGTENFTFPVKMRATPTITLYATDSGNSGKLSTNAGGGGTTEGNIIVVNASEAGAAGQSNAYSVGVTGYMRFQFQAVSEL